MEIIANTNCGRVKGLKVEDNVVQVKKVISTKLTNTNIAQLIALLTDSPVKLESLNNAFSDEQLCQSPESAERSVKQDLVHLLNCEARSSEAIMLALLADDPVFVKIHPERQLGKLLRFDQFPFADLLAYFILRRRLLLDVLAPLTNEQWLRTVREEGKKRKESVYSQARSMTLHEQAHLTDMENKLSADL